MSVKVKTLLRGIWWRRFGAFLAAIGMVFVLFATVSGSAARRYEHIATMLLAIVVAHTSVIWRRSDDAVRKFRNNMIVVALALLLVAVGVTRLRGGWIF